HARGGARLDQEAAEHRVVHARDDLDRDVAVEQRVVGEEHHAGAAAADRTEQPVLVERLRRAPAGLAAGVPDGRPPPYEVLGRDAWRRLRILAATSVGKQGLGSTVSQPASRASAPWRGMTWPLSATTGMSRVAASSLSCSVAP